MRASRIVLSSGEADMASIIPTALIYSKDHLTLTNKQRKPLVERLRRERINSCIEQLKCLLGPQIFKQQPDSKLEKADILEMTVCFLTRLQQNQPISSSSCSTTANQGYSRCVQETMHFLSNDDMKTESHSRLLSHFQKPQSPSDDNRSDSELSSSVQTSITKDKSPANSALWRPW